MSAAPTAKPARVNVRTPEVMERVQAQVESHYRSPLVEKIRSRGGQISVGNTTLRLAKDFGFCYGVERAIDLAYAAQTPPEILYHGTIAAALAAIRVEGLSRRARHHVHLSPSAQEARRVGARRGRPVVLTVRAGAMAQAGLLFYRSDNGVWLTEHVPPAFIMRP